MEKFEIYYGRSSKCWVAYWKDENGVQIGESVNAKNSEFKFWVIREKK